MFRFTRSFSSSQLRIKYATVRQPSGYFSSKAEGDQHASVPPPSSGKGGGFWKLLSASVLIGTGGVVGYAWYDSGFKKTVEENIPYSKDVFNVLFPYLPATPQPTKQETPAVKHSLPEKDLPKKSEVKTPAIKESSKTLQESPKTLQESPKTEQKAEIVKAKPIESKKEAAEREAREKAEKAKELLRKREAEEAAVNFALETGLESLLSSVSKTIEEAVSAHNNAAQAIRVHTEQLKKAMEPGSKEDQWETLVGSSQTRSDSVWSSEQTASSARDSLKRLRNAIAEGRSNATTKQNKMLSTAEKEIKRFEKALNSAVSELTKAQSEAKKLSDYRDLVKEGKELFRKEIEDLGPDVSQAFTEASGGSGRLSTAELNSLIAYAHRRIDQLQRQLVEQQTLEPMRVQEALSKARSAHEKQVDAVIAEEQQAASAELDSLRKTWETEIRGHFETELRQQLARQAAAHSDHLVSVLRAQRTQLTSEFDRKVVDEVEKETRRLHVEVLGSLARVKAIEAAIEGHAAKERVGCQSRELWIACRNLLTILKEGRPSSTSPDHQPLRICSELSAIRKAGVEYPVVHITLSAVPSLVHSRGVFTSEALADRFVRVRRIARRVAMIDENGGTLTRYILSYLQSFFILRARPIRSEDADVSGLSTFALLDNAEYCLRHGDVEQAVRYVNRLQGESRRVAVDWLSDARVLLETRQAAEFLLAFAAANGLGSVE